MLTYLTFASARPKPTVEIAILMNHLQRRGHVMPFTAMCGRDFRRDTSELEEAMEAAAAAQGRW
jgi:hypothetical protein